MRFFFFQFPLCKSCLFIAAYCFFSHSLLAQNDSIALIQQNKDRFATKDSSLYRSPKKASSYSAILPGLGQIYNRKIWKVPLIYAGLGGMAYIISSNTIIHNDFKNAYINRISDNPNPNIYLQYSNISDGGLLDLHKQHRKFMELGYIGALLIYVVNIIDASVDAHLSSFDIDDDLSLHIAPTTQLTSLNNNKVSLGLSITMKL